MWSVRQTVAPTKVSIKEDTIIDDKKSYGLVQAFKHIEDRKRRW